MNNSIQLYLNMYFNIDCIDPLTQNTNMTYPTCKYWHSPMNHVKLLDVVVAYCMYIECAKGKLNKSWNIIEPMKFWEFREKLSDKMLL